MIKKRLFAIIVSLAGTAAMADTAQTFSGAEPERTAAPQEVDQTAIRRVIEEFWSTRVPLAEAMAIAERLHEGSRTVDISFERSGPPVYRVRTVRNERVFENIIDANTGGTSQAEIASSLTELDREDLANIVALKWIKQDLAEAVRIAEKAAVGAALAGGLMKHDGKLSFVVVVASRDRLKEVTLEPPKAGRRPATDR
ncbi:PepSY domain-containing protein [Bradyrhizobium sp. STM 3557]|uniref:PepSY domain-containing protein n=1 Tax=Bradyrhizobium sp. STM 3557 TaxID=578920 RepID=UPI00388D53ED